VPRVTNIRSFAESSAAAVSEGREILQSLYTLVEIADGHAWIVGDCGALLLDLERWSLVDTFWLTRGGIERKKPAERRRGWSPCGLKAFSRKGCRVFGDDGDEVALWETQDGGRFWDRITIRRLDGAQAYAAAVLPSGDGLLAMVSESYAALYRVTPFGESAELARWDAQCDPRLGKKLFYRDGRNIWLVLDCVDPSDGDSYTEVYQTSDTGQTWRRVGKFANANVLELALDGTLWVGSDRGLLERQSGPGWSPELLHPAFNIYTMAISGPGPSFVLNETGFGYLSIEGSWLPVELDPPLLNYWSEVHWLDERRLLFLGGSDVCIAELAL
jgi:hypothetical protein